SQPQGVGLIFLVAREAEEIELRSLLDVVAERTAAENRAETLPELAIAALLGILLADVGVVCGDMADLVPEREGELGLVIHQRHELAGDINVAAGDREGVLDGGIEQGEVERLPGIGDAGDGTHAPAERFDGSAPRSTL